MPWKHKRTYRPRGRRAPFRRTYGHKVGAPLTRTKWTRRKRVNQNLTRSVYWFKSLVTITSNQNGNFRQTFRPNDVSQATDWQNFGTLFNEYKVLKMIVKFIPSSVGSESLASFNPVNWDGTNQLQAIFKRGDTITWVDLQDPISPPGGVADIINKSSAMIFNPRRFHKRYVNRTRGYPSWGTLNDNGTINVPDNWQSIIQIFGENFTPITAPGSQIWFYCQVMFKVLFRGRQEG